MEQKLRTYFLQLSHLGSKERIADAMRVLIQDELSKIIPVPEGNGLDHLEKALGNYYRKKEINYILTLLENYTKSGNFVTEDQNNEKPLSQRYLKILNALNELFETSKASVPQNK